MTHDYFGSSGIRRDGAVPSSPTGSNGHGPDL